MFSGPVAIEPTYLAATLASSASALTAFRPLSRRPVVGGRGVAVIENFGPYFHRGNLYQQIVGGFTAQELRGRFRDAINDRTVSTIVLAVDSPGGEVAGAQELADEIYKARSKKNIIAVADGQMASAAYWMASAAHAVYATPSSSVGSIGVSIAHQERSVAMEKKGVKVTLISAGRNKTLGNAYEPLSDHARRVLQAQVDEAGNQFIATVARNRDVSRTTVRSEYGQGLMFGAAKAYAAGLVDGVATVGRVIESKGRLSASELKASAISAGLTRADLAIAEADRALRQDHAADVRRRAMAALAATEHLERI